MRSLTLPIYQNDSCPSPFPNHTTRHSKLCHFKTERGNADPFPTYSFSSPELVYLVRGKRNYAAVAAHQRPIFFTIKTKNSRCNYKQNQIQVSLRQNRVIPQCIISASLDNYNLIIKRQNFRGAQISFSRMRNVQGLTICCILTHQRRSRTTPGKRAKFFISPNAQTPPWEQVRPKRQQLPLYFI